MSNDEIQRLRNKYLYLLNKNNEKSKQNSGTTTGQAALISNSPKSITVTQSNVKSKNPNPPSQKFSDMIRKDYQSKMEKNNQLLKRIFGSHFKQTGSGQGHWVTINSAHVFIED